MSITAVPVAYGAEASAALRAAVVAAKGADPLAPVTVVVPTNSVGVAARRGLAAGPPLIPGTRGVAGVAFLTVFRLAELLGAPALAASRRRPVTMPVLAAAVRSVLATAPGTFEPVATHPATEEAIVAAYRELADLDDAQLDVLAGGYARSREVVRLHRAVRSTLRAQWYDEHDLMAAAAERAGARDPAVAALGTVVCFLPQRWSAPAARFVHAIGDVQPVTIVAGMTGESRADAAVLASLARVGVKFTEAQTATVTPAVGTHLVSASDPDDEIRAVVRGVVDAMRAGVPLERMAVLYGADEPYARLVHEHLDLAGIPHNGAGVRTLAESVLGRGLRRLLELPRLAYSRDAVCAWFTSAPVLDGRGRTVPGVAWERISRRAGVVRGLDEWELRLGAYAAQLGRDENRARDRARVDELLGFVQLLDTELAALTSARGWAGLARAAHRLVRRFFGGEDRRSSWPEFEQAAARRVEAVLDALGGLDAVEPRPTLDVFARTLELELDRAHDRVGRLGDGVLTGPVAFALGVDLERLWVCGCAEGMLPAQPRDDPLLADRDRAVLDGALRLRAERVDDDHRAFLAALASTREARVCSFPRGDLRRSTATMPSRFLDPTRRVVADDHTWAVPSYAHGVTHAPFPASEHELGVQAAVANASWVQALVPVQRGVDMVQARASSAFTRFDGNLGPLGARLAAVSPAATSRPLSPTRLQDWPACPHAYFVHTVLGVEPVTRPEDAVAVTPLDRGTIVHEVLERFVEEARTAPDAGRPWTGPDHARMHEIAAAVYDDAQARGVTGRRLLWERERRLISTELDAFLAADAEFRIARDARTLATELPFGVPGAALEPVALPLPDGRVVALRGVADRVDVTAAGTIVVIDYKTGKPDSYTALGPENPVDHGLHLQLPVYAAAACRAYGDAATPVEAWYWFVGRGNNRRIGYPVDAAVEATFAATVQAIVDGIEAGVFLAVPPPPGPRGPFVVCPYCDPDGLGTGARHREFVRKLGAPELAGYRALVGGEDES